MTIAAFTLVVPPNGGAHRVFFKDAADVVEIALDWSSVLDSGDTISGTATWTYDGPDVVLVKSSQSDATPYARVKYSAGTNGVDYLVHCTVATTAGLNYRRSFTLSVRRPTTGA